MPKPSCPRIQIAGVHDVEEARLLVDCKVDCIGFPLRLPVHKEDCTEEEARNIISSLPNHIQSMCITYLTKAGEIVELCDALAATGVQLHAPLPVAELEEVRARRPDLLVMKSIIVPPVITDETLRGLEDEVQSYAPVCDAFLTDTHDPATGADGATGKTHDWSVSKRLVKLSPRPIILAGGLNADNVAAAIEAVRPYGVDAHTGVEGPDGRKDRSETARFAKIALKLLA